MTHPNLRTAFQTARTRTHRTSVLTQRWKRRGTGGGRRTLSITFEICSTFMLCSAAHPPHPTSNLLSFRATRYQVPGAAATYPHPCLSPHLSSNRSTTEQTHASSVDAAALRQELGVSGGTHCIEFDGGINALCDGVDAVRQAQICNTRTGGCV